MHKKIQMSIFRLKDIQHSSGGHQKELEFCPVDLRLSAGHKTAIDSEVNPVVKLTELLPYKHSVNIGGLLEIDIFGNLTLTAASQRRLIQKN